MKPKTPPVDILLEWERAVDKHHGVEPLFSAEEIAVRIDELAKSLCRWFDTEPIAQVMMNGAMMFAADLTRAMSARGMVMEMDFIRVKSEKKAGRVEMLASSELPVKDRDILLITDLFETGRALNHAKEHFIARGAQSVTTVALLDKSNNRSTLLNPDFIGFECPDIFVIGYGMDVGYRYRELPFIGRMGQA